MKTYTGKNLEDAIQNAANDKQVTAEELTYTVIEETSGFLGLGSKVTISAYCKNDIMDFMKDYLQTYFDGIQMEATIEVSEDNDFYHVDLDAENNAILIGKNGQTLQSMNAVLKSAVSSEFKKRIRVLIDINGYKEERYKKVASMARKLGKQVLRTKADIKLDPMPADERKVMHQELAKLDHVKTQSYGEGKNRHMVISYVE